MFSTVDSKAHSIRKRMISNVYSKSYLQSSTAMVELSRSILLGRFLPLVESLSHSGSAVDVLELNFAVAMDFINAYLFGIASGSNFLQNKDYCQRWLHLFQTRHANRFWGQAFPVGASFLREIGLSLTPAVANAANREIESWCHRMGEATKTQATSIDNLTKNCPVVYGQLSQNLEKAELKSDEGSRRNLIVSSEMLDHSIAGFETSGITMTYVMYFLSQRPQLQSSLREELLQLSPDLTFEPKPTEKYPPNAPCTYKDLPSARSLDGLPLLHAIILETLRLTPATPGPQPRLTPYNPSSPIKLGIYDNIPGGVRVCSQPCTLHQNPAVFPAPESWKPERWLEAGKEAKEEMMRWFWAFSSGGKMCIGNHFAMQGKSLSPLITNYCREVIKLDYFALNHTLILIVVPIPEIKLIIAAVYTNYTTSIVDDEGMEQTDGFIGRPKSNKLILKFESVQVG